MSVKDSIITVKEITAMPTMVTQIVTKNHLNATLPINVHIKFCSILAKWIMEICLKLQMLRLDGSTYELPQEINNNDPYNYDNTVTI